MKIEYEVALTDLEAYHREYIAQPEVVRSLRKQGFSTAFTTGLMMSALCYGATREFVPSLIVGGFFLLIVWLMIGSALRHETLKNLRKAVESNRDAVLGQHTLEVTPETLTETCRHHSLTIPWVTVAGLIQTTDHLFILLPAFAGFIVPLRTFPTETERSSFIQAIYAFLPPSVATY